MGSPPRRNAINRVFTWAPALRQSALGTARKRETDNACGHSKQKTYLCSLQSALVAKLVDAPDLGSGGFGRVGSSPIRCTQAPHAYRFPTDGARGPLHTGTTASARRGAQPTPFIYIYTPHAPFRSKARAETSATGWRPPIEGIIKPLPFFFPLVCAIFGSAQDRLRLGRGKKNGVSLSSSLALRHFGSAQDRLRLGRGKKNGVSLSSSLALRYLCTAQNPILYNKV